MFLCRFQRQVLGGILSKTIAKPFANNIEQCLMKGGGVGRAAQKCSNNPIHQNGIQVVKNGIRMLIESREYGNS